MTEVRTRSDRHPPMPSLASSPARRSAGIPWRVLAALLRVSVLIAVLGLVAILSVTVVPRMFGYPTIVVSGGSMGDSAPNGSLAIARWVPAKEVQVGDVIVIQESVAGTPAPPKIHRVIALEEQDGVVLAETKGDANDGADPGRYALPDPVAILAHAVPYLGYAVGFVRTPLGWMVFVALPAAIIGLLTVRDIWRDKKALIAPKGVRS